MIEGLETNAIDIHPLFPRRGGRDDHASILGRARRSGLRITIRDPPDPKLHHE